MKHSLFVLATVQLLAACSLVQLSDDITQGGCQRDADCDVLNTAATLDRDPCQRWQCDDATQLCAYGPVDADHDGQSPASVEHAGDTVQCEADAAQQDCADDEPTIGAGFDEDCDLRDNDCDGLTDEAALQSEQESVAVLAEGELATDVAYALDRTTGELAIASGLEQPQGLRPALAIVDPQLDTAASFVPLIWPGATNARAEHVAIGSLDSGAVVYAAVNSVGNRRVMAGIVRASASMIDTDVSDTLALEGLQCASDHDCGYVLEPALATQGSHALVAYLRAEDAVEPAGCAALDADVDVLANLVLAPTGSAPLEERTDAALIVGATRDLAPPAVLALPPADEGETATDYLLAHVEPSGRIALHHVTRDGNTIAADAVQGLSQSADAVAASSIALALGRDEDGMVLGLAYLRGCGVEARVAVQIARLSRAASGAVQLETLAPEQQVGGGVAQAAPALAYSEARGTWAVTFRDRDGLRARVLESHGTLHGDEPYVLIESRGSAGEAGSTSVLLTPAALSLGEGFGMVAHVSYGGSEPRSFQAVRLACE